MLAMQDRVVEGRLFNEIRSNLERARITCKVPISPVLAKDIALPAHYSFTKARYRVLIFAAMTILKHKAERETQ